MAKQLTDRQQEIVTLLDQGKTPGEVARELDITENAVYQHIRRMRANGNKVSTSGSASRSRSSSSRKPPAAKPPAAKPTPLPPGNVGRLPAAEPRLMTPLQAIRARKDALAHDVREADNSVATAERALKVAQEQATKIKAKHGDELKALEKAEAAITGKPVIKAASRSSSKRTSSNGGTPAQPQADTTPSLPGDDAKDTATV